MVLEQKDLSGMLETASVAARLAGQHAMEEISFTKVSIKNNTELVTGADAQCQQMIINRIKETYPDHGFIAEEGNTGKIFKQSPRGEHFWWAIDPIDGTNNYAHRILLFTVSIAVMHEGKPIVGVIFEPATDSMFTAVKGGEAQLNGRRITAGEEVMSAFSSVGLDSHFDKGVPGWACEIMLRTRFRNLGTTALQMAYVAKGSLIATIANRPKLWDIAAGALIAEAAGAVVSDWQGGKIFPLGSKAARPAAVDLDSYQGQELRVITANRKVHAELIQLIKSKA
jgi:myo-inositol-1(or 4)-monophosphatase